MVLTAFSIEVDFNRPRCNISSLSSSEDLGRSCDRPMFQCVLQNTITNILGTTFIDSPFLHIFN